MGRVENSAAITDLRRWYNRHIIVYRETVSKRPEVMMAGESNESRRERLRMAALAAAATLTGPELVATMSKHMAPSA